MHTYTNTLVQTVKSIYNTNTHNYMYEEGEIINLLKGTEF